MSRLRITVSRDALSASAATFALGEDNTPPTKGEILEALKAEGVVHGIDEEAVAALAASPLGTSMVVARGDPPKDGSDAAIRYKIRLTKRAPLDLGDGRVDYKELELVKNVVKGQVLAEKIPPVPCTPGRDVKGREIPPRPVSDLDLPAGRNTAVTPDGTKLVSLIDGHAVVERGKIHVDDTFVLNASVGMKTGNIHCVGKCEIRGHVSEGFEVTAGGEIHIHGVVEGARVESTNGGVRVDQGVRGHQKGRVVAARGVSAKFLENVTVEAGGDVLVRDHIAHSRVHAGGRVRMLEKPGAIFGGEVFAEGGVHTIDLGAEANPRTLVFLGPWRLAEVEARLKEIDEALSELAARENAPREERVAALRDEKETLEKEAAHLRRRHDPSKPPVLTVEGVLYPGVVIRAYPNHEFKTREPRRRFRLTPFEKGFKVGAL